MRVEWPTGKFDVPAQKSPEELANPATTSPRFMVVATTALKSVVKKITAALDTHGISFLIEKLLVDVNGESANAFRILVQQSSVPAAQHWIKHTKDQNCLRSLQVSEFHNYPYGMMGGPNQTVGHIRQMSHLNIGHGNSDGGSSMSALGAGGLTAGSN